MSSMKTDNHDSNSADSYTLEIKVTMSIRSIKDSPCSANISSSQSQRSRKLT